MLPSKKIEYLGVFLLHNNITIYFPRVITTVTVVHGHKQHLRYQCNIAFSRGKWPAPGFDEKKREPVRYCCVAETFPTYSIFFFSVAVVYLSNQSCTMNNENIRQSILPLKRPCIFNEYQLADFLANQTECSHYIRFPSKLLNTETNSYNILIFNKLTIYILTQQLSTLTSGSYLRTHPV